MTLVYNKAMSRQPDAEDLLYWSNRLDVGEMDRGEMMLNFSESQEYVLRSQTERPATGYFNWYPTGTT